MRALGHSRRILPAIVRRSRRYVYAAYGTRRPTPLPSNREVLSALSADDPLEALSTPLLRALPTVRRWGHELDDGDPSEFSGLIERANRILRHEFDLLGSGPYRFGERIDWQLDFKSGRRWPLHHHSVIRLNYPDGSDIKVPWELSRSQHLPILAAANRLTNDRRYVDELGAQILHWIAANPVGFGANWACTMDSAIRAVNWVAALALVPDAVASSAWVDRALAALLAHGRFIAGHLEWDDEVRGNHYLAGVAGLLPLAALFGRSTEGRTWAVASAERLRDEMQHQVHTDGVAHEASIPYHRLVCEIFAIGGHAADAVAPGTLGDPFHERLRAMVDFTVAYTRPDGLAPCVGDNDDGRFLPLGDYGAPEHRDHAHLLEQCGVANSAPRVADAFPAGGFFVARDRAAHLVVRCGDTGLRGRGGHGHNDQLSFEYSAGAVPMVIDPGSYVYTADPAARNAFRATSAHTTLQLDAMEQCPLGDGLFVLHDRSHARCTTWERTPAAVVFEGRHAGFSPALVTRRLTLSLDGTGRLDVHDTVHSDVHHRLVWRFTLAPCELEISGAIAVATYAGGVLTLAAPEDVALSAEPGWISTSYGRRTRSWVVTGRRDSRRGEDRALFTLTPDVVRS